MLEAKRRVGRPRKTTNEIITTKKVVTKHDILKDVDIVLNGLLPKVAKGVLDAEEATAMLRILVHLKIQSKVKPSSFKAEQETYS
tara:strand:+ start:29 stop:283 length:255 start_codon:yes stop_codon:yes gene_type:complete